MPNSAAAPRLSTGEDTRRVSWLLGAAVFVVHCLSPIPQSGDSRLSAITAWQFLHHFTLDLHQYSGITSLTDQGDLLDVHGHLLPFFPWPPMLLAVPADLVVALLSRGPGLPASFLPEHTFFVEVPTASALVAITTVVLYHLLRELPVRISNRSALLTAALFAFGSSAWSVGSRALWQQTVSMLMITAALLALRRLDRSQRWAALLGVWVGLAAVVRPTNAVFAVLVVAVVMWRHRPAIRGFLSGAVVVALLFLGYSWWQYGQLLPPYYEPGRLSDPSRYGFIESVLVNLVSPSRGLLFFDPVILLAVLGVVLRIRRHGLEVFDLLLVATVVGQLLVIGKYGSTGGFTYGPRLMLDVVPMLMVLAAPTLAVFDRRAPVQEQTKKEPTNQEPADKETTDQEPPDAQAADVQPAAGQPAEAQVFDATDRRTRSTATRRLAMTGLVVLIVWSVFVNAGGAVSRAGVCWNSDPVSVDTDPGRVWDLSDPQFLRPARALLSGESWHDVVLGRC